LTARLNSFMVLSPSLLHTYHTTLSTICQVLSQTGEI